MTPRNFTEQDLHLALDGEMSPEDRQALDLWLDNNPEMQARMGRFSEDRDRLRAANAHLVSEPIPERFQRILTQDASAPRLRTSWRQLVAASLVFALGAIGGYSVASWRQSPLAPLKAFADSAIQAHDMYAAEKLHVVEVKADQRDHLIGWLSKRVGVPLVAPDLSTQGYELIGGRLLPDAGKAAAQFMYQNADGDRVSLYVTREQERAQTGFKSIVEGSTRAYYWMDDDYGCAVAGVAPQKTLLSIADSAYRQYLAAEIR